MKKFELCGKLGNLPTYVLSGCDEETAGDENNHSGLGGGQLLRMIVLMKIAIKIREAILHQIGCLASQDALEVMRVTH